MSTTDEDLSLSEVALATLKEVRAVSARLDEALRITQGSAGETAPSKDLVGNLLRCYQRLMTDNDKFRRRLEAVEKALGIDPDAEFEAALRRLGDAGKDQA